MENNIPKVKMKTIPHPEIDEEIKTMMKEIKRIKILLMNNVNYTRNKGKMLQLRENIRERWKEKAGMRINYEDGMLQIKTENINGLRNQNSR